MRIVEVTRMSYGQCLASAQRRSDRVRNATTPEGEIPTEGQFYLTEDGLSGFAVLFTGEIVGLFSTEPGRGTYLVHSAISHGGTWLNCFDGYLTSLYRRCGFVETHREPNWVSGRPDVVYMCLFELVA